MRRAWYPLRMVGFFMGLAYKGAEAFIIVLAGALSFFGGNPAIVAVTPPAMPSSLPPQTALIMPTSRAGAAASNATETTAVIPDLLPQITLSTTTSSATAPPPAHATAAPAKRAPALPPLATAEALLSHTTTTLAQRTGGAYGLVFNAVSGGKTVLSWQYGTAAVGGSNGIPRFSATYSCDPPPSQLFAVRTNYSCTVSLTPTSGADLRTQTHQFDFTTGFGEFLASPPANMDTHLVNDENDGGFVFTNDDTKPITVLSETFVVSYTGLSTAYGPLVLRLMNPAHATDYIDYHLENIPPVASSSYLHRAIITLPMPVAVGAANAKMLPIKVLGVHKLSIVGVNPTITITLDSVTTDRSDILMRLGTPHISWGCIVALSYDNPNATSGPFATGEACQN